MTVFYILTAGGHLPAGVHSPPGSMGMPGPVIGLVALATKCPTPDPGPRADAFATPGKRAHNTLNPNPFAAGASERRAKRRKRQPTSPPHFRRAGGWVGTEAVAANEPNAFVGCGAVTGGGRKARTGRWRGQSQRELKTLKAAAYALPSGARVGRKPVFWPQKTSPRSPRLCELFV